MALSVSPAARATGPYKERGVRYPLTPRTPLSRPAAGGLGTNKTAAGTRRHGSVLARRGTSVLLQMKDADILHPQLWTEDTTTPTTEKIKAIEKTKEVLLECVNPKMPGVADAGAVHQASRSIIAIRAFAGSVPVEPLPSQVETGRQVIPAPLSQLSSPPALAQAALPTAAQDYASAHAVQEDATPGTLISKLYWAFGALVGAMEGVSKLPAALIC